MSSIVSSHLSFGWPDDTPLFADLSFTVPGGRTGLVAPNGAGKSTLLRLIAGEYRPTAGTVTVDGTLGYLPQTLPFDADRTVADVLGVAPVIAALDALAAGDASEAVFAAIGDDWDVEERLRAQLDRLGLADLGDGPTARLAQRWRGGVGGLAAQLLRRPDVLLLDEPTNNLDVRRPPPPLRRPRRLRRHACWWSATTACCSTGWIASPSCTAAKWSSTEELSPTTRTRSTPRNGSPRPTCATPSRC